MHWLRLIRFPAVFTAMADIFLGFLIITEGSFAAVGSFAGLLIASACLYFSGMVLNDVFDVERDRRERSNRPLPSQQISVRAAVILAIALMLTGTATAFVVSQTSGFVAIAIVGAVLAYDWLLKNTGLAPTAMGLCRTLNVLLGASVFADPLLQAPVSWIAVCLGAYIAGVTWFARQEAAGGTSRDLIGGSVVITASLCCLILLTLNADTSGTRPIAVGVLGLILVALNRRFIRAIRTTSPADVGPAIGTALLALVLIDASLVLAFAGSVSGAIGTAALLVPAIIVRRWIPIT